MDIHEANYLGDSAEDSVDPDMTLISLSRASVLSLHQSTTTKVAKVYWEPALSWDLKDAEIKMWKTLSSLKNGTMTTISCSDNSQYPSKFSIC